MYIYTYTYTHIHTYICESLCCNPETNTTLQINYYFNKNNFLKKNQLGSTKRLVQNSPGTNPIPPIETEDDTPWCVHSIGPFGFHLVRGAMDMTGPIGPDMALQINELPAIPKGRDDFSKTIVNENSLQRLTSAW